MPQFLAKLCACGFSRNPEFKFWHFQNVVFDLQHVHVCGIISCIFLSDNFLEKKQTFKTRENVQLQQINLFTSYIIFGCFGVRD